MKHQVNFCIALFACMILNLTAVLAQDSSSIEDKEAAYTKVITQRADKIVAPINITDPAKATRVRNIIVQQYRDLNEIHESRDIQVKAAKEEAGTDKKAAEASVANIEAKSDKKLKKLHKKYITKLATELSPEQVDQVKDGMTYGVLPITYNGYLSMLPDLTNEQKSQIMSYLVEAREHAMDAGSSEKKHQWFGKYKGKINNYLSSAGYDLKKAGEEWEKRIKAEAASK